MNGLINCQWDSQVRATAFLNKSLSFWYEVEISKAARKFKITNFIEHHQWVCATLSNRASARETKQK